MRSIRGAERRGGGAWGGVSPPHGRRSRRGAPRGRGVGRGFPPTPSGAVHGRRWRGSRSDARYPPVGEAPRTRTSGRNRCPYRSRNRAGCFPHGVCGGGTLVRSIRGAERRGRGVGRGFPVRGSRSDARYPPVGEAPRTRTSSLPVPFQESCGVLSPRSVRWRNSGAVHSRRGAPRGRGVGRGFPAPRKTMARIAERCAVSPRGGSAAHAHKWPESLPVPFQESCGVLSPRGLISCAVPPAGQTVPRDRGRTGLPRRGPCPERIGCSGAFWPPFRRIPGRTRTPCPG